jgi:hypothetical protein
MLVDELEYVDVATWNIYAGYSACRELTNIFASAARAAIVK